ncbi:MAG: hypothetical protein MUE81_12595 [Thermoflexibacter sp.]|nr:hypothetical protein [Thermoflexibacter sp.]
MRNKFKYKSIALLEIDSIEFKKGKYIKNWLLLLLFGLIFIGFSVYYSIGLYNFFTSSEGGRIYIEEIVVPVIPLFMGIFAVVQSLKVTEVMIVKSQGKRYSFSVGEFQKNQNLKSLIDYFKERLGHKKISVSNEIIL